MTAQAFKPFDRIPVRSLKSYRHKNETVIRKNGAAELWVPPTYAMIQKLYLMPVGTNLAVETDAELGIHFEWA